MDELMFSRILVLSHTICGSLCQPQCIGAAIQVGLGKPQRDCLPTLGTRRQLGVAAEQLDHPEAAATIVGTAIFPEASKAATTTQIRGGPGNS